MCNRYHLPEIPPQLESLSADDILCLRQITKHSLMENGVVKGSALYERTRRFIRQLTLEEAHDTLAMHRQEEQRAGQRVRAAATSVPVAPVPASRPVGRPPLPRCPTCGQKTRRAAA